MTRAIETSIWLALRTRLEALVLDPVHTVAWPNESFDQPAPTVPYLRVTWLPNVNRRLFLDGADPHQRLSIFQIDAFEVKNKDSAIALEMAGQVAAHFPADLKMTADGITAQVVRAPTVAQPLDGDTHLQVPVTIPIEVFA